MKIQTRKVNSEETIKDALVYLINVHATQGYPPTVREIGESVGYTSSSSAMTIVRQMVKRGWITMVPYSPRTIMVTEKGKEAVS